MSILKNGLKNSIAKAYLSSKKSQKGFTLVELIIVVAVMTFLGWMMVPIWGRYISKNKQTVCRHNRENILKIYERCVYDTSVDISTQGDAGREDLNKIVTGLFPITNSEVYQYQFCPKAGDMRSHYEGNIRTNGNNTIVASIGCDTCEDEVSITLDFWVGGNHGSGVDMEITPLPDVSRAPGEVSPAPSPVLPPTIGATPTPPPWPYAHIDSWWDPDMFSPPDPQVVKEKDLESSDPYIKLKAPLIIKDNGQEFFYIDSGDPNQMIKQSEADSPTNFSSKHPNWLIPIGAEGDPYDYTWAFNGLASIAPPSNGDIVVFSKDGVLYKYIYYCKYSYEELWQEGYDPFATLLFSWDDIIAGADDPCADRENEDTIRVLYKYN